MSTDLERALGYTYRNRSLLETALSHSSYANEAYKNSLRSYERLEFLGDSVLGFLTAEFLFRTFPDYHEGELTRIRSELVCEQNLADVAEEISLGDFLLLGHGEAHGGGRHRSGILCDVMESLIAAAYLDGGLPVAKGIVERLIFPKLKELGRPHDYKTELQELVQQRKAQVLSYELISESGPDHCKEFTVRVLLNGQPIGEGSGTSKKRAEQAAAAAGLSKLSRCS